MAKIMFRQSNSANISTPAASHSNLFIDVADGFIKVRNPDGTITNYAPSGSVASANAYTDSKIAALIGAAPELLDTLQELSDAINDDPNFATSITALISQESADRIAALSAEQAAREAADLALQDAIDAEQLAREGADSTLQGNIDAEALARQTADGVLQVSIEDEVTARTAADDALSLRLDALELDPVTKTYVDEQDAATLSSAQGYTDTAISNLVNAAPEVLDTLKELADALGSDPNFASTVASQIASEQSAREAADDALDLRLDALEADAVTKSYVDSADAALQSGINDKVSKSGDTMSGALAMGSNKITGLADGSDAGDAVNKSQLDTKQNSLGTGTTSQFLRGDLSWQTITPDVVFSANYASLPSPGDATKLYVTKDNDKLWYYKEVPGSMPAMQATPSIPASPTWTVGATGNFPDLAAAMASGSVLDGDSIMIQNGTYTVSSTINITKQVQIYGQSKSGVILETAASSGAPVSMINVSVSNVTLQRMTIKHKKTSNTSVESALVVSGPGSPQTRVDNFDLDDVRIEHIEFGVTIRGSNWKLSNSQFVYAGPNNSTRRHVGIYGVSGTCFAYNNESEEQIAVGVTGNTRWYALTSTTGTNPNETYEGSLVLENNRQTVGNLQQFYSQDSWQGSAGGFSVYLKGNQTNETSAFVSFYGTSANFANILSKVYAENNSLSNLHGGTPAGGKGMIGFDGAGGVAPRSSALPVEASGNTLSNLTFRADYAEASGSTGSLVGYSSTNLAPVSVTLSGTSASTYTPLAESKYVAELSWSGSGPYTMSIPASTHGMGSDPIISIKELLGGVWVDCVTVEVSTNNAGDITISSAEVFDGKVVVK